MKKSFATLLESVDQPLIDLFNRETAVQRALREMTVSRVTQHRMMTSPEQVQFLQFVLRSMHAKRVIEVGVFTGYGTLAMAQALPDDGKVIACDHSDEWPALGKTYWEQAGVADKIQLQIAPAMESLQALLDEGQAGQFDFIFVDADKIHYADYEAFAFQLLREEGMVVFDNVLWVGEQRVVDQAVPATSAIASLLTTLSVDDRYETTLVPIAQGMLLARKRGYTI